MSFIVAIDGPAGVGKGTITKIIAEKYGFVNIDTGAIYRCVALEILNNNINMNDEQAIKKLLDTIKIEEILVDNELKIYLNGNDVTEKIRSNEVNKIVSLVSGIKQVRLAMAKLQRNLGLQNEKSILDGRDIGTFVFPDADVKIYLDASIDVRAQRRFSQNKELGIDCTYEEVYDNIKKRDENDKNKEIGALKIADDAIVVDTSDYTLEENIERVCKIVEEKMKEKVC